MGREDGSGVGVSMGVVQGENMVVAQGNRSG